jgi:hypothetical protein
MPTTSFDRIAGHRSDTFRLRPHQQLRSKEEAVSFVNERGFVYFWPIKEIALPSLWAAVAGERPVADAHDDPGHVTWGWKDQLLGARQWYYAKVLRKRSTMISLETLPYFYALTENYGAPDEDYLQQYREGKLSHEAKTIYEVLLEQGPLDSPALRTAARMTSRGSDAPFSRAMTFLQTDFKVLPVGVAEVGSWKYAFIYELTHRHYPDLAERARPISTRQARTKLTELYLRSVGGALPGDVSKVFGWATADVARATQDAVESGIAATEVEVEGRPGKWVVLRSLL